ncbi:MAG: AbrB family transcriptional regulator [Hyphomicrobiaceae bacterium]
MTTGAGRLAGKPALYQWSVLLAVSFAFVIAALWARLPAALLIGPMVAAILIGTADGSIRVSLKTMISVQGVIGMLMGRAIPLTFIDDLGRDWPLVLMGLAGVIVAASLIGLFLTRWGGLPGTTGVWGISAGASTPMILMSEAYGGDPRIVAVMQQIRIILVIAIAALVARIWTPSSEVHAMQSSWLPAVDWVAFLATIAIALGGAFGAVWMKIPAGPMLVPLMLAVIIQETGLLKIELPPLLLALCYALVGWNVGLRFTRPILWYAFRALPIILAATFALIAICGLLAGAMVLVGDVDPLTAYLATSPGGADTIAIIAASSAVDMRFVMAMQTSRLVVVLLMAPSLSRLLAKLSGADR